MLDDLVEVSYAKNRSIMSVHLAIEMEGRFVAECCPLSKRVILLDPPLKGDTELMSDDFVKACTRFILYRCVQRCFHNTNHTIVFGICNSDCLTEVIFVDCIEICLANFLLIT